MKWRNVAEISKNVYWVGVKDWDRKLFDALIPLPKGTSYNSYLVVGEDKKALIDTVNPGFEGELEEKVRAITDPGEIDYLIMNHAEPDHAGAIPYVISMNEKVKVVTTSRGAKTAQTFYKVPENRIIVVNDQDAFNLGGKTLRFIEAPMLHWPETMFTYLHEDRILFPCDFFGSHLAEGFYDEDVEDLIVHAQRYFGEIMMPFRIMAQRALKKIEGLELSIIAPSHGPIYRNPRRILEMYRKWANGETKRKVVIAYVTMWGSTERMIEPIAETLASEGIHISLYNLALADVGDLAKDLVDSRGIVLGAPTVLGGMHPLALYAAHLVKALKPPLKYGVVVSSYGWGGGTVKQALEILSPLKIEVVGTREINGPPSVGDEKELIKIGKQLAEKIKGG